MAMMNDTDLMGDQPRRRALIDALSGDAGVGSPAAPPINGFNDHIAAQSIYDTSAMTPDQRGAMQQATASQHAQDAAGFARDQDYLTSRNGQGPEAGYQFYTPTGGDPSAGNYGGKLVGGSEFDHQQAAGNAASAAQTALANPDPNQPRGTLPGGAGQYQSSLHGFNMDKLNDPNKHDPKYDFARLAQNYPPTPDGLAALSKDPAFAQAGYKVVGKDKIQVPNGSVIDVGEGFSDGGKGWAWQPVSGPDAVEGQSAGASANGGFGGVGIGSGLLQSDPNANIQQALSNIGGYADTSRLQQLIAALGKG